MFRSLRCLLLVCFAIVLQQVCFASDPKELIQTLNQNYAGKSAMLRGFYCDSHLEYDSDGNHLGSPKSGAWTACAFVEFKEFNLRDSKIEVEARRTGITFNKGSFVKVNGEKVKITFALAPGATASSLEEELNAIFYDKQTTLIDVVPSYWKCYVMNSSVADGPCGAAGTKYKQPTLAQKVGRGISPPRAIHDPDPGYTRVARKARLGGAVLLGVEINESGRVENINIVRPLGLGLDDAAVSAVRTWTFEPARSGDVPVRVQMTIEINFHPEM